MEEVGAVQAAGRRGAGYRVAGITTEAGAWTERVVMVETSEVVGTGSH